MLDRVAAALVPLLILCVGLAIHVMGRLNHDVAYLAWGARELLNGAVIGRDIVEINFPLAFIIYVPAAALSEIVPLSTAIRLWIGLLFVIAMVLSWRDVPAARRFAIYSVLAAYVALFWPREFAQREQVAMLLVFAFIVPGERRGWRAVAVGVLAGVGFAIKPHFLLVWLCVEIGRRPLRTEQLALIAAGLVYALSLVFIFDEFTFELLPTVASMYAASDRFHAAGTAFIPLVVAGAALLAAVVAKDGFAKALALASVAFGVVAVIQLKFYGYHFIPLCGYSLLALVALLYSTKGALRVYVVLAILILVCYLERPVSSWWSDSERRMAAAPFFLSGLDGSKSFIAIGVHPYPAFPTAIYAEERGITFLGKACCASFLPAAVAGDPRAAAMARGQLLVELRRRPDVVLVDTNWRRQTNIPSGFDGLAWFLADAEIAREWEMYRPAASWGPYRFYRRDSHSREGKGR